VIYWNLGFEPTVRDECVLVIFQTKELSFFFRNFLKVMVSDLELNGSIPNYCAIFKCSLYQKIVFRVVLYCSVYGNCIFTTHINLL
jgi:hypothetical protein